MITQRICELLEELKMILFDSHSHIDDKAYQDDLDEVLERAEKENVQAIMIAGIDVDSSLRAAELASGHTGIVTSVGIHPHEAQNWSAEKIEKLVNIAEKYSCVKAWGEIGLDFNRMFSPVKDQEACFIAQLEAAQDLDLPLICHERDSSGRFYELLKRFGPESRKGVIHCFSGTQKEMFSYLDLGYHIGITGIVTHKKRGEYLRKLVPMIPEDRILIETDCPYLTPSPVRNRIRRNEPCFVKLVLLKLAEVRNTDPDRLSQVIFDNTRKLYGIQRLPKRAVFAPDT